MTASNRLYLDHAATTPVLPAALAAIAQALETWANPSSPHAEGRAARSTLEKARQDIAEALDWRHDVIFTSGASEAVEIVAKRARISGRAHGATEHAIVPHAMGPGSKVLRVRQDGLIDEASLDTALTAGPALVAIQQVNNETGVIQPLDRIAARVRDAGSLLLADCAQSAGKMPLPDADFIAACAHKLGGPPGVGVLLVKDSSTLEPVGGQERGNRRGTQDAPSAAGFAAALTAQPYDMDRLTALRSRVETGIVDAGGVIVAGESPRIATIGSYAMPGVASSSQLVQFDLAGIAVSAGSACSSGSMKPSVVLEAMGLPAEIASCFVRVSFGADTGEADVDRFLGEWRRIHDRAS
ncbi:aminotransferase class V-fold PLP-dependent enzyme [Sphingomonas sp. SM33]|uniref:Cysteine desulfurase n=1 Tax=Sphingomonas telluris TaxID=2907998 RepID=A0ABS9VLU2_9SPHN|nr:aminotransferase class V-fold PLP-dependent enzyme [Sphingomonas telluris]MCH8615407.1 aminotransferase class V-fold PLP-dependent enzyme [Sphingomonas telluris]